MVGGDRANFDRGIGYLRRGDRATRDRWYGSQGSGSGGGGGGSLVVDASSSIGVQTPGGNWFGTSTALIGHNFTSGGGVLDSAKQYTQKVGSPPGNLQAVLYDGTGDVIGAQLAASDLVPASSTPASPNWLNFPFSGANRITLVAGNKYFIEFYYNVGDSSNRPEYWYVSGAGITATFDSGGWHYFPPLNTNYEVDVIR